MTESQPLHPQLAAIVADLEAALARTRRIANESGDEAWTRRPAPDSWSAAECIAHLNLTSEAYVKILPKSIEEARALDGEPPGRFRRDLIGWLIGTTSGRNRRLRVKTSPAFLPTSNEPKDGIMTDFERLQKDQMAIVREANGLPIHRVKVASPFANSVRYSLYSALKLLPEHQHRHLEQAELALRGRS